MISIRNSTIRILGYSLLLVNILLFFLTWLRWPVGIPAAAVLLAGFFFLVRDVLQDQRTIQVSIATLLGLCGLMLAWTLFCGLGGVFPQKGDLHWRNAILHDLINYDWPVRYLDLADSSLTYYIAFWLGPSLLGKFAALFGGAQAGWIMANAAYAVYCAAILCVVLLLLISYLNAVSFRRMLLVATILVFFSGLDVIPTLIKQSGSGHMTLGTHLEWWDLTQYSSNTTQLAWVFNQAVPAWLVTALLFHERKMDHYAFLGLMLLPYGPLPFLGIFMILALSAMFNLLVATFKRQLQLGLAEVFSWPNLASGLTILPIFYFYFAMNKTTTEHGLDWNTLPLFNYLFFIMTEFMIYALLLMRSSLKKKFFLISVIGLLMIPRLKIGVGQDFSMRVSIPLLFILMIYLMEYLLTRLRFRKSGQLKISFTALLLIPIFLVGAVTPLVEFKDTFKRYAASVSQHTTTFADYFGTLNREDVGHDNFIAINSSDTFFYRFLARK